MSSLCQCNFSTGSRQQCSQKWLQLQLKYLLHINALERNTTAIRLSFYIIIGTLSGKADSGAHTRLKGRSSSHTVCLNYNTEWHQHWKSWGEKSSANETRSSLGPLWIPKRSFRKEWAPLINVVLKGFIMQTLLDCFRWQGATRWRHLD